MIWYEGPPNLWTPKNMEDDNLWFSSWYRGTFLGTLFCKQSRFCVAQVIMIYAGETTGRLKHELFINHHEERGY